MANDTQVHWLTQDSYDRLMAEKEALIANRPVIAAEINERREEGDLKENAGYHAAREQQGQEEARIRTIDDLLANAQVGETPTESGVALGLPLYDLGSTWRDQAGRERPIAALAGRTQLVAMVYTHCTAACPLVVENLKRIDARLPADRRGRVGVVLVSLDPARDTPERLAEFARAQQLPADRWTLLAGAIFVVWPNTAARTLLAASLLVMAATRIYLGVHWTSDVVGGVLLGVAGLAWAFREKGKTGWR